MTTTLSLNQSTTTQSVIAQGATLTKGKMPSAPRSFRKRHEFWLDLGKPRENRIANLIAELKEKRSFASSVRDGLRLIVDLRAGRVDVLRALFPSVVAQIEAGARPPDSPVVREFAELMQKQTELLARLAASPEPARMPELEPNKRVWLRVGGILPAAEIYIYGFF